MLVEVEKLKELCNILLPNETNNFEYTTIIDKIYSEYFKELLAQKHNGNITTKHVEINKSTNLLQPPAPSAEDVWIFGYGSLVWKADFPYIDSRPGYICGFKRRFYQNSIDHRGTEEKPGRVVTLLPAEDESERVYGIAYRIAAVQKEDVLKHLDYREKNGYERREVMFFEFNNDDDSKIVKSFPIIMYIATQTNDSYAGNICELTNIAQQIFTSAGPSGRNRDYLFNLATTMRQLFPGVNDEHLFTLEESVLQLIKQEEPVILESAIKKDISSILDNLATDKNIQVALEQLDLLKNECVRNGWKETVLTKYFKENSVPQN